MAEKIGTAETFAREALFSKLPALPHERVLGWIGNSNCAIAANICTWLFVTGCWVGMLVPVKIGIILSIAAVAPPMLWICYISRFAAKYGTDQGIHARATWGTLGSVIILCALIPIFWGWSSIPTVMFGRAIDAVATQFAISGWWSSAAVGAIVCLVIGVILTNGGPIWHRRAFLVAVPAMIVLLIAVTIRIITYYGWSELMAAKPPMFLENPRQMMLICFELNIGIGISWLCNQSEWARSCKSERIAFWPNFISWGFLWGIFSIPGIFVGAIAGMGDPVQACMIIGGSWTVVYLVLLLLANPSSLILELYFISLTLRTMFSKLTWKWALAISMPPILLLTFLPGAYDQYQVFVTLIGAIFVPIAAVWVLDIMLKKFKMNMKEVYDTSRASAYHYWKGINWCAFVAAIIGIAFSFSVYNPLTIAVHWPGLFNVIGASVPAGVLSGVVYYIFYRTILRPKRIGMPEVREYTVTTSKG